MIESIGPWVPRSRFWTKKRDFWHPFLHRFFYFFRKWQKCETSCARAWALTQRMFCCTSVYASVWVFGSSPMANSAQSFPIDSARYNLIDSAEYFTIISAICFQINSAETFPIDSVKSFLIDLRIVAG